MEAKDTVMTVTSKCSIIFSPDELTEDRMKQAGVSFEAGKQEGYKEGYQAGYKTGGQGHVGKRLMETPRSERRM